MDVDARNVLAACPAPLALPGAGGALEPLNPAMRELAARLGDPPRWRGGPPDWRPGKYELVVDPAGGPGHGDALVVRVEVRPLDAAAGAPLLLCFEDRSAAQQRDALIGRLCTLRPLVPALVHELNNFLHVTLTVCDQFHETLDGDGKRLLERTEHFVRHFARVLATVRSLAVRRDPIADLQPLRLDRLLERTAEMHHNFALEAGVELRTVVAATAGERQVLAQAADLIAVVSQLLVHALTTRGGVDDVVVHAVVDGELGGLCIDCGGDPEHDRGLRRLHSQPTLRIGARPIAGFTGDTAALGAALVALALCAGEVRVAHAGGRRRLFAGAPLAAAAGEER